MVPKPILSSAFITRQAPATRVKPAAVREIFREQVFKAGADWVKQDRGKQVATFPAGSRQEIN
jgi:hypothetical protein